MMTGNDMSKTNKMLAAAAMVMCLAPAMTWAAENDSDEGLNPICELSGGTAIDFGGGTTRCCWANWGCMTCSADDVCVMDCDTARCCEANGACFTMEFPEEAVFEEPADEPGGRPGRPGLGQPLIDLNDSPVVASPEGQDVPGGVSDSRFRELILDMGPDTLAPAFEPGGVIDDSGIDEAEEENPLGESDDQLGEEGSVNPAGICGAGGGASLMFGLMGLVGLQRSGRRRRTGTAQGGTNGRAY